jgi:ubiquinone/menaquinone biosynthesis C-methylase UbiE
MNDFHCGSSSSKFDNYLTEHLGYTTTPESRNKKKEWLRYNYQKILPGNQNAKILEIGPGHGELLELLIRDMKYENVVGADISAEVVSFCNQAMPNSVKLLSGDNEYLKENHNSFDVIFVIHVLEHIPKSETHSFLSTLHYALKPSGVLIVEVPNMANPVVGLNFRYADFTHEVGYTDASLKYVLRRAGFSDVSVYPTKVPAYSIARKLQHVLQLMVGYLTSLIVKIYIPSSKQINSAAIYAISKKDAI